VRCGPFVRLDEARGGNAYCGLGLAIVRRLVRYNGGTFHAANGDGGGFVVSLTLPVQSVGVGREHRRAERLADLIRLPRSR
jgi:signal transduction histidine kinase